MANKLFEMMNAMPQMPGALGNLQNVMTQFNQFRSLFHGNGQQAQQQVQQMLNSGQLSQERLNQAIQYAQSVRNMR